MNNSINFEKLYDDYSNQTIRGIASFSLEELDELSGFYGYPFSILNKSNFQEVIDLLISEVNKRTTADYIYDDFKFCKTMKIYAVLNILTILKKNIDKY